jgi:hypothetical protein
MMLMLIVLFLFQSFCPWYQRIVNYEACFKLASNKKTALKHRTGRGDLEIQSEKREAEQHGCLYLDSGYEYCTGTVGTSIEYDQVSTLRRMRTILFCTVYNGASVFFFKIRSGTEVL